MHNSKFKSNAALTQILDGFVNSTIGDFIGSDFIASHPRVNIFESEIEFKIELAAPGLYKSDFKISLEGDTLIVSSEMETKETRTDEKYMRREFNYSTFSRKFNLPKKINRDGIDAKYLNGILKIILPKKENTSSANKKIEIK